MRKSIKILLSFILLTVLVMYEAGCAAVDGLSLDNSSKTASASASDKEEPEEPQFQNKAEVTIYKTGTDQLLFVINGDQCKGLVSDDIHANSNKQFTILIGEEKTEVINQEDFEARGIEVPEPEEGEEPITYYELTTFDLNLQANLYSYESTAMISNGEDWSHFKTKFDDGSTYASDTAYFTTVSAPNIADKINASNKYLLYFQDKDAEDVSEDDLIAMGTVKSVVKEAAEEELIGIKGPVYLSGKASTEVKLDWAGTWKTDEFAGFEGTITFDVTDKGIISVHVQFPDMDSWYYGEEGSYYEEDFGEGAHLKGAITFYNIRNEKDRLSITYDKLANKPATLSYAFDDFQTVAIRANLYKEEQ